MVAALRRSLSAQIVTVALVLSTVSASLIGGPTLWLARKNEESQLTREIRDTIDGLHYRLKVELSAIAKDARALASNSLVTNVLYDMDLRDGYLPELLRNFVAARAGIRSASLFDYRGRPYSPYTSDDEVTADPMAARIALTGKPEHAWLPGPRLRIGYPVTVETLETPASAEGALIVEIDVSETLETITEARPPGRGISLLSADDRSTLWYRGDSEAGSINSITHLLSTTPLEVVELSDEPLALLQASIDRSVLTRSVAKMGQVALLAFLLLVALSLALSIALACRLVKPLQALTRQAGQLAADPAASGSLIEARGTTEVETLAASLTKMLRANQAYREELALLVSKRSRALSQSEGRLATLLAGIDDVLFSCSTCGLTPRYASPSLLSLLGMPRNSELTLDATWPLVLAGLGNPKRSPLIERIATEGAVDTIVDFVRPDGTPRSIRIRARRVESETGSIESPAQHVDGVISDVTDQVRAERERASIIDRLSVVERALRAAHNGILISEVTDDAMPIVYANPRMLALLGVDEADLPGLDCNALSACDEASGATLAAAIDSARRGQAFSAELGLDARDGRTVWCALSIAPVPATVDTGPLCIAVFDDITERKRSQHALLDWTQRVDAVFSLSPDGFACFDQFDKLVATNPTLDQMLGLDAALTANWTVSHFTEWLRKLAPALQAGELERVGLGPSITPGTGAQPMFEPITFSISRPAVRIVQMQVRRYVSEASLTVVYLRDITRESEIDRAKSEFLSTAAHELRTPLSSLHGYIELLRGRQIPVETQKEMLDIVHRQTLRLASLLSELLDLARIEAGGNKEFHLRACSLENVIADSLDAMAAGHDEREVEVTLPDSLPTLCADPAKLQQALINVLSNAYKYSPDGGPIAMTVELNAGDHAKQGEVVITVTDHGIGMRPGDAARVFDRFFRADRTGKIPGTGLGMPLVKEIIEHHGGTVSLQSEFGRGTAVTLRLPVPPRTEPEA